MVKALHHKCNLCCECLQLPQIVSVTSLYQPKEAKPVALKSFKERRSLTLRKDESTDVRQKYPHKLPIIVEKAEGEKSLPTLDRVKFLAPDDMSMSQFIGILRSRLNLKPTQAFYLMVRNRCITTLSQSVAEVYWEYKDEDGFLYTTYAAHEMYGSDQSAESSITT
ncbi:Microtubule-associated proteins 1A/1B light chain 3C, partial [Stegodyphus mimosarum]